MRPASIVVSGIAIALAGGALTLTGGPDVTGLIASDGPGCLHSLEGTSGDPTSSTPREAIRADRYASEERGLLDHEHRDPMYVGFKNDSAVYWTQRLPDGMWKISERYRIASCDRNAFTGEAFAPDDPRPIQACEPFDVGEPYDASDVTDAEMENAPECDAQHFGVPVSGIQTGPMG